MNLSKFIQFDEILRFGRITLSLKEDEQFYGNDAVKTDTEGAKLIKTQLGSNSKNDDDYESKDKTFDLSEKEDQNTRTDVATAIRRIHDGLAYHLSQSIHGADFTELTSNGNESPSIINSLPENDSNSCCLLMMN